MNGEIVDSTIQSNPVAFKWKFLFDFISFRRYACVFVTISQWHASDTNHVWIYYKDLHHWLSTSTQNHTQSVYYNTTHIHTKHLIRKSIEFNDCDRYFVFVHILFTNKSHVILQVCSIFAQSVTMPIRISHEALTLRAGMSFWEIMLSTQYNTMCIWNNNTTANNTEQQAWRQLILRAVKRMK